jgi:hypothetical protein
MVNKYYWEFRSVGVGNRVNVLFQFLKIFFFRDGSI